MIEIENLCVHLQFLCRNNQKTKQLFYWLTPTPNNGIGLDSIKAEFDTITLDINTIVKRNGFLICDRLDIWTRRRDLVVQKTGYFNLHGN